MISPLAEEAGPGERIWTEDLMMGLARMCSESDEASLCLGFDSCLSLRSKDIHQGDSAAAAINRAKAVTDGGDHQLEDEGEGEGELLVDDADIEVDKAGAGDVDADLADGEPEEELMRRDPRQRHDLDVGDHAGDAGLVADPGLECASGGVDIEVPDPFERRAIGSPCDRNTSSFYWLPLPLSVRRFGERRREKKAEL